MDNVEAVNCLRKILNKCEIFDEDIASIMLQATEEILRKNLEFVGIKTRILDNKLITEDKNG